MATKPKNTVCVTCHTELPPGTKTRYFTQSLLFPTKDDLGFGEELTMLMGSMGALFDVIGNSDAETYDDETVKELGKLGYEVAIEARRRMHLLQEAENILCKRYDTLRRRCGEEVAEESDRR